MNTTDAPAAPTEAGILQTLADHGYRSTAPRRAVVAAVMRHDRPFTAEQIVAEAPEIGRATVYRTLEVLAAVDVLTRILQADGHPAYVVGAPGHRHHLVCARCGATVVFTRCPVDDLVRELTASTQYDILGHHLEVFGVCPGCAATPASS